MFAILRTKRIKGNGKITQVHQHNNRISKPKNCNTVLSYKNKILIDTLNLDCKDSSSLNLKLNKYYEDKNVKIKIDNVHLLEFVATASPEFFKNISDDKLEEWISTQVEFFKNEFGDNLKNAVLHMDETSPHIHFLISTEHKTIKKYRNQKGEFHKETWSLNAKRFNRDFLINLHDRHADANKKFGLERGIRNSKATHTELKEYYRLVDKYLKIDNVKIVNDVFKKFQPNLLGYVNYEETYKEIAPVLNKLIILNNNYKIKFRTDFVKKQRQLELKEKYLNHFDNVILKTKFMMVMCDENQTFYKRSKALFDETQKTIEEQNKTIEDLRNELNLKERIIFDLKNKFKIR